MSGKKENEKKVLTWRKILPSPLSARYKLITGEDVVVNGMKALCDSGHAELAYNVIELIFGRQMPVLASHLDFIPEECHVFSASEVFDYEDQGYIFAIYGYSGRSDDYEFSCIFFDDELVYGRICTMREVQEIWERFIQVKSEKNE